MELSPGQIIDNRYRVVSLLGQGGFGAVYRVWDTRLETPRALKENLDTSLEAQRQFKREAQILDKLSNPYLPKVIDHFLIPDQGQYLIMEFVEGEDLQKMLEFVGGPLPEAQVLEWVSQVCDALLYLHSQEPPIIHRDIKPANIKITPQGKAMLVDFGIAKVYDPILSTTVGARAITPGYSPHEQYGAGTTDARTDVYALGATLYHLLTGAQPVESIQRTYGDTLRPMREIEPSISPMVEQAVLKAMQPNPSNRYKDMTEFKEGIVSGSIHSIPQTMAAPAIAQTLQAPAGPSKEIYPKARKGMVARLEEARPLPWKWIVGGAVGVLAIIVIFWIIIFGGSSEVAGGSSTQTALALATNKSTEEHKSLATSAISGSPTETSKPTEPIQPTSLPTQLVDKSGASMALIPAGEFEMGIDIDEAMAICREYQSSCESYMFDDEGPVHTVNLNAYYIDIYEVTNPQYAEFLNEMGNQREGGEKWLDADSMNVRIHLVDGVWSVDPSVQDHPAIEVTWYGARAFCEWRDARLPTEAEWEKAARGGLEGAVYPWGDEPPVCVDGLQSTPEVGSGYVYGICQDQTTPVGSFSPNGYGLYDMVGNVTEWVSSLSMPYPYQQDDGREDILSTDIRVFRGGTWGINPVGLRIAYRNALNPKGTYSLGGGFRCARSMDGEIDYTPTKTPSQEEKTATPADISVTPEPPTNLDATAISSSQIDLIWTDNSDDETSFRIEHSPNGTSDWSEIESVGADVASYADDELKCESTHYYRVRARFGSDDNYSGYSNIISATTLACSAGPTPGLWEADSNFEGTFTVETDGIHITNFKGKIWTPTCKYIDIPEDAAPTDEITISGNEFSVLFRGTGITFVSLKGIFESDTTVVGDYGYGVTDCALGGRIKWDGYWAESVTSSPWPLGSFAWASPITKMTTWPTPCVPGSESRCGATSHLRGAAPLMYIWLWTAVWPSLAGS